MNRAAGNAATFEKHKNNQSSVMLACVSITGGCVRGIDTDAPDHIPRLRFSNKKRCFAWTIFPMNVKNKKPRILIAGLGNELLSDDGVGVHAVRGLLKFPPVPGIIMAEVGTAVLNALHLIEWADRIIALDAMQASGPAGTIYEFGVHDVAENSRQASLHELNFMAALRFLPARLRRPEVTILGVEPETISYGLELSPSVQAALPRLVTRVRNMITGNLEKPVVPCMNYP